MNIMKKISLALALCCASFYSMADQLPLGGFSYGPVEAPTGKEWESPENLALNKEQPHAYIFPFQDVESARKVLPENSKFWQSLDGDWKFNWAPDPDSRPKDFYKTEFDVSGWDNIPENIVAAYDTYSCKGLPAGPISNPGIAAIKAALAPQPNEEAKDAYFFVTDLKGSYYYARTLSEHSANCQKAAQVNKTVNTEK